MSKANITTAVLAGLSFAAVTAAYLIKGTVPDVLTILSTTVVGGYLGITTPTTSSN